MVVAGAAALSIDQVRAKVYQGTAEVLFTLQGQAASTSATVPVTTDLQLVDGAPEQAVVAQDLHLGKAPKVTVTEVGTTNVAQIAVRSPNASFATKAANDFANAYIHVQTTQFVSSQLQTEKQIQGRISALQAQITNVTDQLSATSASSSSSSPTQLQAQLTNLYSQQTYLQQQLGQVQLATAQDSSAGQLVTPAVVNHSPVSPKKVEDLLLAVLVGLLLGIGLALLRDHFDDRIRGAEDLEEATSGLPTIGLVPAVRDWRERAAPFLVSSRRPRSPAAEAYRTLRTSVQFMALERPVKLLQVTSPAASEGKTTTSANLAYTMAEAGQHVVLIDCDLRRPRVHEFFGLSNDNGLTSVLTGHATFDEALHKAPGMPNLLIFSSGPIPPNPAEILAGERAAKLFRTLSETVDVVILDSSPVLPVTDAIALAARVDGVLLVATAGVSTERGVSRTLELLGRVDARVVGTVLNRAPEGGGYSYYRYRYGSAYGYGETAPKNGNGNGTSRNSTNGNGYLPKPIPAHTRRENDE